MSIKCTKCWGYGITVITKTISGHQYDYAFLCDCWAGIGRDERYPSISDADKVKYSAVD